MPDKPGLTSQRRSRILAPFLAANPLQVLLGHLSEYRLSRQSRTPGE